MKATLPKLSKCKVCRASYRRFRSFETWCSPECGAVVAQKKLEQDKAKKERQERKDRREKLKKFKTPAQLAHQAQAVVNKYVRLRDAHLGCVSCDKPASWGGQWHASHFRSRGAASAVRFHLWNIHKSCSVCNNHKSGNLSEYEPRLRQKIGDAKVDWLRTQNQRADYSPEYLDRLKKVFSKKIKRLEGRQA